jgi:flagellar biosynthesis/type III secretory pathway chaperone
MIDEIITTLDEQIQILAVLNDVLAKEKDILEQCQHEPLEAIAFQKNELLQKVEAFEQLEKQLPSSIAENLNKKWKEVLIAAQKCRDQNFLNGMLIRNGYQQVHQLLSLLLGRQDSSVYTKEAIVNPFSQQNQPNKAREA